MTKEERDQLSQEFEKIIEILAAGISSIIRTLDSKEQRFEAIKSINPSVQNLKQVLDKAIKNEDYETCDVINEYISKIEKT